MKLFVKLIFAALFLAVALPFTVLKGKDGRPLMSIGDLKMPNISLPKVPDAIDVPKIPGNGGRKDIIYQWRDADGVMQFTTQPPPAGIEYSAKGYDPNTNLIQSVEIAPQPSSEGLNSESEQNQGNRVEGLSDIGSPYSPEKIEKLIDDANNVQKLLNDRMKQQEAMIGQ